MCQTSRTLLRSDGSRLGRPNCSERLEDQARGFAPWPPKLNELQQGVIKAKARLRAEDLLPGQP
jgi:hypothetical protein